jgi:glycosyltransferase involved in cell wall biosynthesis
MLTENKRVAYINFWSNLFKPHNGGTLRAYGLFNSISKFTHAELINVNGAHNLREVPESWRVQDLNGKAPFYFELPVRLVSIVTRQGFFLSSDSRNFLSAGYLNNWFSGFNSVILTSREMLLVVPVMRFFNRTVKVIYDSHNVDYLLAPPKSTLQRKLRFLERLVPYIVDEVWCCSDVDRDNFTQLNKRFLKITKVVPNGATPRNDLYISAKHHHQLHTLGIIGSWYYPPNVEGLEWFLEAVLPLIDDVIQVRICGIGQLPSFTLEKINSFCNVEFIGRVDDVAEFYKSSHAVAIPLFVGSGTRLKVLEAMSFATPMVSTSKGVEGIPLENGLNCFITDSPSQFARYINQLFSSPALAMEMGQNANKHFHQHYTWDRIVQKAISLE